MPSNATKQVLVPVEDAQGECYHAPGGCGGHLVTTIEATAAELVEDRGLRPCRARGCKSVGVPTPTRCDGCGTPIFEPELFNDAEYCKGCATHLHKFPSKKDHEQYALLDPELRADGGRPSDGVDHAITVESTQLFSATVEPANADRLTGDNEPTGRQDKFEKGVKLDPSGEIKRTFECSCGKRFRKGRTARDHLEDVSDDE